MLDEIVGLLQQIKSVGDNIAHDLRSPLAAMRTKLERGLAADSGKELRAAVEGTFGDLEQPLATVATLLRIAEIEWRRSGFMQVDLARVCANVFKLYEPLAEAKPVASRPEAPAPLPVPGDFELLVEAIANGR
jgi:signal transduction histidine kinase